MGLVAYGQTSTSSTTTATGSNGTTETTTTMTESTGTVTDFTPGQTIVLKTRRANLRITSSTRRLLIRPRTDG